MTNPRLCELLGSDSPSDRDEATQRLRDLGTSVNDVLARELDFLTPRKPQLGRFRWLVLIPFSVYCGCTVAAWWDGQPTFIPKRVSSVSLGMLLSLLYVRFGQVRKLQRWRRQMQAVVLELARRDDRRALYPLLDLWEPTRRTADGRALTVELARMLPAYAFMPGFSLGDKKRKTLRGKLRGSFRRNQWGTWTARPEITQAEADVFVTLLQLLARSNDKKDQVIIARIAHCWVTTDDEDFVRDAAQACLEAANGPRVEKASSSVRVTALNTAAQTLVRQNGGRS